MIDLGKMYLSTRHGIIALLEKLGKDFLNLASWKPLTLLNTDNKIFTKTLVRHMRVAQEELIHTTQTGFVKGSHMAEGIIKIMQILHHTEQNKEDALLVSFDFRKAFDTVEFETMIETLKAFNFGEKFIQMVSIIFDEPLVCAYNNGYWSEFFQPTRGCRQGCCYSPLIFTQTVELLSIGIRSSSEIKGIMIGEAEVKIGQFADDLWASLKATQNNLNQMLKELEKFSKFSGLIINPEKTAVLKLGPFKDTDAKFYTKKKLFWSPKAIKILGFHIYPDSIITYEENSIRLFDKMDDILQNWSKRPSTPIGRITVVNSLINSLFVHKLLALPTPTQDFFQKYRKRITDFIWQNKTPKIAYSKLVQDYHSLGLKLVDLEIKERALKASWPIKWKNHKDLQWFYHFLQITDERIWECNLSPTHAKKLLKINEFNMNVAGYILVAWTEFHFKPVLETEEEILNTPLGGNLLILRQNLPIFDLRLVNSNIHRLIDIVDVSNKKLYNFQQVQENFGNRFDYLFYLGLIAAIPNLWKNIIRNAEFAVPLDQTPLIDLLKDKGQSSKFIYWSIIKEKFPRNHTLCTIMQANLDIDIQEEQWWELFPRFIRYVKPAKL